MKQFILFFIAKILIVLGAQPKVLQLNTELRLGVQPSGWLWNANLRSTILLSLSPVISQKECIPPRQCSTACRLSSQQAIGLRLWLDGLLSCTLYGLQYIYVARVRFVLPTKDIDIFRLQPIPYTKLETSRRNVCLSLTTCDIFVSPTPLPLWWYSELKQYWWPWLSCLYPPLHWLQRSWVPILSKHEVPIFPRDYDDEMAHLPPISRT